MSLASIDETLLQENTLRAFEELRFDDAVRMLEPLAWTRQDPELLNNLGALYFQLNWSREAEAAFRQALRLEPTHPTAVLNLCEQFIHYHLPWAALRVLEAADAQAAPDEQRQAWAQEKASLKVQLSARRVSVILSEGTFQGEQLLASMMGSTDATRAAPSSSQLMTWLQGLLGQSYPLHEILVQENSALAQAIKGLPLSTEQAALFRFIAHQELPGRHTFANLALKKCTGEYLTHVTLNLQLDPTWLERALAHMLNPEVGAVGTRQVPARPDHLLERWLQAAIGREHGSRQLQNPSCLGEPGGVYRVSALKRIGGWNGRWAGLSEEVDRANRLTEAGFTLRYESSALFHSQPALTLGTALHYAWHLRCINRMDAHVYERMERTAAGLSQNSTMALRSVAAFLTAEQIELLYPSFFSYYAWILFDVQQVHTRGQLTDQELSHTVAALYLVARHHLRHSTSIPAKVVERALTDLDVLVTDMLLDSERHLLDEQAELLDTLPDHAVALDELLEGLQRLLPKAHHLYVSAFAEQRYLTSLGHGMGTLLEKSVEVFEAEAVLTEQLREGAPHVVLFNPPARGFGGTLRPEAPASRWLTPSRQKRLTARLNAAGAVVSQLDAVALKLDARVAEERLLALNPSLIVFSAQDGGLDRMIAAARRLKLVGPPQLRQVLIHAGSVAEAPLRRTYAMFDEIFAEEPGNLYLPRPS